MTVYQSFGLHIDGQWKEVASGGEIAVIDPVSEDVLGTIPRAGADELDTALEAVARMAPVWAATPGWQRSALLRETARCMADRAERAAWDMSVETGKPLAEAKGEWQAAVDQFDWYADEARRIFGHTLAGREPGVRLDVSYAPVGPVAAFTAWNFPALLPARKVAAALAAGCPIIVKPSEEAPSSMAHIAECAVEAGLPKGVLNVVLGDPAEISAHLIASPVIRKVSLTGSVPVGKLLMAQSAQGLKKLSMELGGHAPVLVYPDADPVRVGEICGATKFRNAGQVCISPTRFFVHEDVYESFAEAMARVAKGVKLGRGTDEGVQMGPMANARGRDRVAALVQDALDKGADLLAGGSVPAGRNQGFFFEPTVLGRVPMDAAILREEPFGPVAPIVPFRDHDEVIRLANDTGFGLAGYVFSGSLSTASRAAEALEVGMVGVNDMLLAAAEVPFGGVKDSGFGREGGQLGILEYLEAKYVKTRYA